MGSPLLSREEALRPPSPAARRAARYQALGLPLPLDVSAALLAEGLDPSAFDS